MLNLIRKDILLQKKTLMILVPALLVYLALDISYIWSGFVFSIVIIWTAFTMDEKSQINILLNSLPYTRKDIVSSKYIGALIFTCIVVLTIFIGNVVFHRELILMKDLILLVSLVMISVSFMFPFSYRFKSQSLFICSIVLFAIYLVLISTLVQNLHDLIRDFYQMLLALQDFNVYLIIIFSTIVLYICSWLLSIRIYKNKVF
ncbi:ABC-2 transporter permease [Bacillus horti]|uniref:ABC-type transport system involved in multi-copper enzyme maturation permease subunit n=1 Tax=Caldalkalibacillus horti TaxID=77523 RepID=A0ABT9VXZ1_9BACI|nr:ABC-2 transporter permease [Bacillus horti]MDQ0165852.1 ABC-type transport system involved in multi-copper enzyme maturation permease subunit [Bacillus horti]